MDGSEAVGVQPEGQGTEGSVPESQPQGQGERGRSPWADDLDKFGPYADEVDKYLAERWQPRMTKLEQQYAPFDGVFQSPEDAKAAADLLYMYREDMHAGHKVMTEFIQELVDSGQLPPAEGEALKQEVKEQAEAQSEEKSQIDPEYQKLLDELKQEREDAAAQREFQRLLEEHQKEVPGLDEEWFAKLLLANGGDVYAAVEDFKTIFPDKGKPKEEPPPTMGDGGTSTGQTEGPPEGSSLKDLIAAVVRQSNS